MTVSNRESDIRNSILDRSAVATKALLVCGAVAGPLFMVAWLAQGAARANYDPLQHPISSLSIAERGWMQIASFIITGLLILAFSRSGSRRARQKFGRARPYKLLWIQRMKDGQGNRCGRSPLTLFRIDQLPKAFPSQHTSISSSRDGRFA
jgi:hypothetical protein